jgi:FkbM family methyltransferase
VYCGGRFSFLPDIARYAPLDRPTTVLDAGANIGAGTLLFAALTRFAGDVLALEPLSANSQLMRANLGIVERTVQFHDGVLGNTVIGPPAVVGASEGAFSSARVIGWGRDAEQESSTRQQRMAIEQTAPALQMYALQVRTLL